MVSGDALEKVKKEYQNSDEEQRDLLEAYELHEGDMDAVYEDVMCSNVLDDDERFREIIDTAIKSKEVQSHKKYTKESAAQKQRRVTKARKEESEAMELAEELGVKEKLFGSDKTGKKNKSGKDSEASLVALIQQRQKGRAESFLDELEAKYGGDKKKKRAMDEPPEEAFQKNRNVGAKKRRAAKA
jgi:DnaJ homolog subfamily C member 9